MTHEKKPSATPGEVDATEAEAVEAMRKIAEGEARPLTPEEAEAAAKAGREYIAKLAPQHNIDTPVYKPPV